MGFGIEVPFALFSEYLTSIFREPDVPFRSAALYGMLASDPFMLLRPRDGSQKESHRYTRVCECCNKTEGQANWKNEGEWVYYWTKDAEGWDYRPVLGAHACPMG